MASTAQADQLTETHRLAQRRLGVQTVARMLLVWPLLNPDDLDETTPGWLTAVSSIVAAQWLLSSRLAAGYLQGFRTLELGTSTGMPSVAPAPLDQAALATSLLVTGPVSIKTAMIRGASLAQAVDVAKASSAAAGMRHTLNGGRATIETLIERDDQVQGHARVASGSACGFCAMLASRGPVYSANTGAFRSHDGCGCSLEPVYHRDAGWPANSRRYEELWQENTAGLSATEALNAFRRAVTDGS